MLVNYGPASQISSSEFLLRVSQLEKSDFEQTTKLAQIEGTVDGITSTVSEEFIENVNNTTKKVSNIEQTVDSIKTAVTNEENGTIISSSTLLQTVDGFEARVVALEEGGTGTIAENVLRFDAKTGLVVDGSGGTVTIKSGNLNLTGAISFSDISDGTTTVDNLIDSNTTVTGAAQDALDAYNKAVDAQRDASTAIDTANTAANNTVAGTRALSQITDWINGDGTTSINGSSLKTGTVVADYLAGSVVYIYNEKNGNITGSIKPKISDNSSTIEGMGLFSPNGNSVIHITNSGAYMKYDETSNQIGATASGVGVTAKGTNYYFGSTALYPETSGSRYLGLSANRWNTVYISSGTIQTSDRNQKNSIESLPDKYIALFDNLEAKRYKMNDGTSGRYHVGFIAQDVEEAMAVVGIDSQDFGGFVKDKDENDNDTYMLRYDEFIGILAAKIKQLESRIEQLEAN